MFHFEAFCNDVRGGRYDLDPILRYLSLFGRWWYYIKAFIFKFWEEKPVPSRDTVSPRPHSLTHNDQRRCFMIRAEAAVGLNWLEFPVSSLRSPADLHSHINTNTHHKYNRTGSVPEGYSRFTPEFMRLHLKIMKNKPSSVCVRSVQHETWLAARTQC